MCNHRFFYIAGAWLWAASAFGQDPQPVPPVPPVPRAAPAPRPPDPERIREIRERSREDAVRAHRVSGRSGDEDALYERGQRALDDHRWDEAVAHFTEAAARNGARADGALYWKAYALGKLGRRDEAMAVIAELRKAHASSRWLDDAKALELEVRQASGQGASPESQTDEDLKLMALNGLVQSDPERALPLLEKLLQSAQSPKLKARTLFVLAQSDAPRARQLVERVARGGAGNPDLQLKAISYLSARGRKQENGQLLWDIYSSATDLPVKRALLHAFIASRDKDHLLQIARTEKTQSLRLDAISALGGSGAYPELAQLYAADASAEAKARILESLGGSRNTAMVLDLARAEKDAALRRTAVRSLGGSKSAETGDALAAMYGTEQDEQVKKAIVDALTGQGNAKLLVELARKEPDPQMKRQIVSRLSGMKSKEAADYLLELLK